ncbi:MAG: hypothetical protein JHC87_02625 [Thermoleophilaceae bacterium]|nr:hypothetical protein [Thermoleophilaceae bacterium]
MTFRVSYGNRSVLRGAALFIFILGAAVAATCLRPIGASAAFAAPSAVISGDIADGASVRATHLNFVISADNDPLAEINFACALDQAALSACDEHESPSCSSTGPASESCTMHVAFHDLSEGTHVLHVLAASCYSACDSGGTWTSGVEVTRTFTVDRQKPLLSITGAPEPGNPILSFPFLLQFVTNEPTSFQCFTKTTAFTACTTPFDVSTLGNGEHVLGVKAVDAAGNVSDVATAALSADAFMPRSCPSGKSKSSKARRAKCTKSNAKAKRQWKKKHRLK